MDRDWQAYNARLVAVLAVVPAAASARGFGAGTTIAHLLTAEEADERRHAAQVAAFAASPGLIGAAQMLACSLRPPERATRAAGTAEHAYSTGAGTRVGSVSGGSAASIWVRAGSSQGGRMSCSPRCAAFSSMAKPGPSVASSNNTPPGSRK